MRVELTKEIKCLRDPRDRTARRLGVDVEEFEGERGIQKHAEKEEGKRKGSTAFRDVLRTVYIHVRPL
jgi:hypothetical protein